MWWRGFWPPGEVIKVDTGNVFAFEPSISYEIETVKGVKNILVTLGDKGVLFVNDRKEKLFRPEK